MSIVQVRCKDCRGYGRETWTADQNITELSDDALEIAFYALIFEHHQETHRLNTQNSKANGGDNEYIFFLGRAVIGYAAVSSEGKHFQVTV